MPSAPLISVVVPTCDKPERLVLALHSLVTQSTGEPRGFEVLVVADGCSSDPREAVRPLRELGLPIAVIETPRIGQAAARNLGAAQARGDLLLFMDDDVLLSPDYLRTCLALRADEATVVRAPVYLLRYLAAFRDPERGIPYGGAERPLSALAAERVSRATILNDWPAVARKCRHQNRFERLVAETLKERPPRYPWLGYSGSGVALSRRLFERAGGYDEAFALTWGAEAIELGYRLWRMGARFVAADGIYSAHMDHPRGKSLSTFDASFDLFFSRHGDPAIREVQALILAQDRRPAASMAV
ncbi:MAG: glycosyltransferase family 2 protein [Pseudolabrys sp.]